MNQCKNISTKLGNDKKLWISILNGQWEYVYDTDDLLDAHNFLQYIHKKNGRMPCEQSLLCFYDKVYRVSTVNTGRNSIIICLHEEQGDSDDH